MTHACVRYVQKNFLQIEITQTKLRTNFRSNCGLFGNSFGLKMAWLDFLFRTPLFFYGMQNFSSWFNLKFLEYKSEIKKSSHAKFLPKNWQSDETRHLAPVSVMLFGSCNLLLFVSSTSYFEIVRRQCCLKLIQVKTQTSLFNIKEIVDFLKIWLKDQFFTGYNLWPGFWKATKRQVGKKSFPH